MMDKYWSALNWLTSHRLKYIALITYLCTLLLTTPFMFIIAGVEAMIESKFFADVGETISDIYKGERI